MLELGDIRQLFHLPQKAAAQTLGVHLLCLKKSCRRLGIRRWPQRKVTALEQLLSVQQAAGNMVTVRRLQVEIDAIYNDPDTPLSATTIRALKVQNRLDYKIRMRELVGAGYCTGQRAENDDSSARSTHTQRDEDAQSHSTNRTAVSPNLPTLHADHTHMAQSGHSQEVSMDVYHTNKVGSSPCTNESTSKGIGGGDGEGTALFTNQATSTDIEDGDRDGPSAFLWEACTDVITSDVDDDNLNTDETSSSKTGGHNGSKTGGHNRYEIHGGPVHAVIGQKQSVTSRFHGMTTAQMDDRESRTLGAPTLMDYQGSPQAWTLFCMQRTESVPPNGTKAVPMPAAWENIHMSLPPISAPGRLLVLPSQGLGDLDPNARNLDPNARALDPNASKDNLFPTDMHMDMKEDVRLPQNPAWTQPWGAHQLVFGQPQGLPQVQLQGLPLRQPQGLPQGQNQGLPLGQPQVLPPSQPQTWPQGLPLGQPQGLPPSQPQTWPQGLPLGQPQSQPQLSVDPEYDLDLQSLYKEWSA